MFRPGSVSFSKSSFLKSVMVTLTQKPEGMTFSEIMNHIAKQNNLTPEKYPKLFSRNGNLKTSMTGGGSTSGFMQLKREFLAKNIEEKYILKYPFTLDQIDRLKIWSPKWQEAI